MSRELGDLRGGRTKRLARADRRTAPRAARASANHKRASVRAPLVSTPMTSAHPIRGTHPRSGALFEMTGVASPP